MEISDIVYYSTICNYPKDTIFKNLILDTPTYDDKHALGIKRIIVKCNFINKKIITLENCEYICDNCFENCNNILQIDLPKIKNINPNCFRNCVNLCYVNINSVINISQNAFSNCVNILNVYSPNLKRIHSNAFNNCYKLQCINLELTEKIFSNAFYNCTSLVRLGPTGNKLFKLKCIYPFAFCNCSTLNNIYLLNCNTISKYAFSSCLSLTTVYLPKCERIDDYAFMNCSNLIEVKINENCYYNKINSFFNCYTYYYY